MTLKTTFNSMLAITTLTAILYMGVWFYAADKIQTLYPNQKIQGFPFLPYTQWSGIISLNNGTKLEHANFRIAAQLFPRPELYITSQSPMTLTGYFGAQKALFSLPIDEFKINIGIPTPIPTGLNYDHIKAWQAAAGRVPVSSFSLKSKTLNINAQGNISLDTDLQPKAEITAKLTGAENFILELEKSGVIQRKFVLIANSFMQYLSKEDETTKERYIALPITIQNQAIYMGPLLVAAMSPIAWPGTPPAPDQ